MVFEVLSPETQRTDQREKWQAYALIPSLNFYPNVTEPIDVRLPLVELTAEEVECADSVVLLTDHDAFDLDVVQSSARHVLDTRARLQGPHVERL